MFDPTENLSKDMAKTIVSYFNNRNTFFAFSAVNRKLRRFFQGDREQVIQQGKIIQGDNTVSFFLTFSGEVYGCGANVCGQLGLIDNKERNHWTKTGPAGKKVLRILSKSPNTFAFCNDGVYACGNNQYGQMGASRKEAGSPWVKIGPAGKNGLEVKNTHSMIFVRCEDGWYGCGHNFWGAFGTGDRKDQSDWTKITVPGKVIFELIAESTHHTFVRCEDGWYGCGSNQYCELGSEKRYGFLEWIKIAPPGKAVTKLIPSGETIFVCCEDGWYARGSNQNGLLGTGDRNDDALDWIQVGLGFKNILELYINGDKCIFIRCEYGWYGCGWDSSVSSYQEGDCVRRNWTKIEFQGKKILEIRGEDISEIFVRCDDGWYGRGPNSNGELGIGKIQDREDQDWAKIGREGKEIFKFFSNRGTFILCDDGWYACGNNYCGQLGTGDTKAQRQWIKVLLPAAQPAIISSDENEAVQLKITL